MPDEEIETSGPACARGEHTVSETLGKDPTRASGILATESSNDDVEDDGAATDRKIGGTASIPAMDKAGRASAERAMRSRGGTAKGEGNPIRIRGHTIHDEAGRHRITSMKSLIHGADSFSNQHGSNQRTSSKVSQTQNWTPITPRRGSKFHAETQTKVRGLAKVRFAFTFAAAAYNLVRLPKLLAA